MRVKIFTFVVLIPTMWENGSFVDAMSISIDHYDHRWVGNNSNNNHDHNNNNDRAAIVFLHGLGDDSDGWSTLEHMLPSICPRLGSDYIHYSFPQAPTIGITLNGGMRVPGWFDLYDWPIDTTARDDYPGQVKAVRMLEEEIEMIEREEGIPASRIIVGGFAQGAALAMLSAFSRRERGKEPYAGCVCLSGWLPMRSKFTVRDEKELTPLLWAHGEYDEKVLHEQQIFGVRKLRDRGVDVVVKTYPVGHESCESQEIEAMAEFIDDVLYPKVDIHELQHYEFANAYQYNDQEEATEYEYAQQHGDNSEGYEYAQQYEQNVDNSGVYDYSQQYEQNRDNSEGYESAQQDENSAEFLASVQYLFGHNTGQFHP